MTTTTATPRPDPKLRRAPKPVTRVSAVGTPMLEDRGCHLAPICAGCWLVECWYVMAPEARRQFREALALIKPFVRQADTTVRADSRPDDDARL